MTTRRMTSRGGSMPRPETDLLRPLVDEHPHAGADGASLRLGLPQEASLDGIVDHVHDLRKTDKGLFPQRRPVRVRKHPQRRRVDQAVRLQAADLRGQAPTAAEMVGQPWVLSAVRLTTMGVPPS